MQWIQSPAWLEHRLGTGHGIVHLPHWPDPFFRPSSSQHRSVRKAAVPVKVVSPEYRSGELRMPAVDVTAARDATGSLQVGIVNLDPKKRARLALDLLGVAGRRIDGQLLTGSRNHARNSLDGRQEVAPVPFKGA